MSATASTHSKAYAASFRRRRFFRWGRFTSMTKLRLRRTPLNKRRTTRSRLLTQQFFEGFARRTKTEGRAVSVSEKQNPKIEKRAAAAKARHAANGSCD